MTRQRVRNKSTLYRAVYTGNQNKNPQNDKIIPKIVDDIVSTSFSQFPGVHGCFFPHNCRAKAIHMISRFYTDSRLSLRGFDINTTSPRVKISQVATFVFCRYGVCLVTFNRLSLLVNAVRCL